MTFLEVVNKVLRRLREPEVTTVAYDEYSQLIGSFVTDILEEVAEAHDWSSLYHTVGFGITAGEVNYDLSALVADGGDVAAGRVTNQYSTIARTVRAKSPHISYFESVGAESGTPLPLANSQMVEEEYLHDPLASGSSPSYVSLKLNHAGLIATVYPVPDATGGYIKMRFFTPIIDLELDGTDDNTDIEVPWKPVYLGALYLALNERGEEIGEPGNVAETRYLKALGAAKEADTLGDQLTNVFEFWRD